MKKISVIILVLLLILTFSMASVAAGFLLGRDLSYNIVNSSSGDHDFSPTNINTLRSRSIDIIGVVKICHISSCITSRKRRRPGESE